MAFVEDPTAFLGDFGLTVTAGATSGLGILDMPGEYVGDGDIIISTDYTLRCQASKFGSLEYGDPVVVDGLNYTVRDNRLVDDGVFTLLTLSKIDQDNVPAPDRPISEVRIDTSNQGVIYVGQAIHGAVESTPVWKVTRSIYNASGVRTSKGVAFNVAWTARTTATYS